MKKVTSDYAQAVFNLPWLVAADEGLFAQEDIEVEFLRANRWDPTRAPESDPSKVDPFWRHAPFADQSAQFFNACEWGQINRSDLSAAAGQDGRIVQLRPAVVSQGIFVRPDSPITHPASLANKTVAVNFHAGSHYLTLQMLEGFMPREEINVVHMGQAELRYKAMLSGQVDAAALMEPYITIAEKAGCNLIIEGHYAGSEMSAPDVDPETHAAINRALTEAVRRINLDKRKYLHYLIADVPADLGPITAEDFHLPRLRYVEPRPYPSGEFERTHQWMVSWGLASPEASFQDLVDNRIGAAS